MLRYAALRTGQAAATAICAILFVFACMAMLPGDPAQAMLGERVSDAMAQDLRERMQADEPLLVRFPQFIASAATGDFGRDPITDRPIGPDVATAARHTIGLAAASIGWALLFAIPIGIASAVRQGSGFDTAIGLASGFLISLPAFLAAVIGLLVFAVWLGWLPASGTGDPQQPGDAARHLVLPALAVGVGWLGYSTRLVRASMLETLQLPFVAAARIRGLPPLTVLWSYAARTALQPVLTVLGLSVGKLLSGAVFAELIFQRPGLGSLLMEAASNRNQPLVMATITVSVALYVAATLLTDLIAVSIDPRLRKD